MVTAPFRNIDKGLEITQKNPQVLESAYSIVLWIMPLLFFVAVP